MKLNMDDIFFIVLVVTGTIIISALVGFLATGILREILVKIVDILLNI